MVSKYSRSGINRIQKRKGTKKGTDMCKHLKCSYAVIGLIIFFLGGTVSATGYKTTELNRKMAEISSLQHSLSERIALAMTKKEQLKQKTESLKQEIRQEKEQMQIESYYKAALIPRIDYNLKLIQLLLGYTTRLKEKIVYFQNGHDTLDFYFQQAQDDLLMIKTLNDLEVDKLITLINSALDEYTPETTKPLFDVDGVPMKDTEQIWNDI
jgi:hypothetical protein